MKIQIRSSLARLQGEFNWRRSVRQGGLPELELALGKLSRGDWVIDIGGAGGLFALAFASKVGGSGRVISLEPNPRSFERLSIRSFGTSVMPMNVAASDTAGELTLSVPAASDGLGTLRPTDGAVEKFVVPTIVVDDSIEVPAGRLKLIKVDVEGWEMEALRGAKSLITREKPSLLVEIEQRHLDDRSMVLSSVVNEISSWGYSCHGIVPEGLISFDAIEPSALLFPESERPVEMRSYVNNFLFQSSE